MDLWYDGNLEIVKKKANIFSLDTVLPDNVSLQQQSAMLENGECRSFM